MTPFEMMRAIVFVGVTIATAIYAARVVLVLWRCWPCSLILG